MAQAPAAERGLVTSSVDPEVSAAMQVYDRLEPLKNALGIGDLSVPEMQLFAMVAHRTGLDPFTRQIYAIKRANKVTHQTGIDGYRSVAERTGQYLGSDEATYEDCTCGGKPEHHPAVARVVVHRAHPSGHVVDQLGVARWHELVPPQGQDSMWQKMPFNQLAKCAEANALRKAFPRVLGDVYIGEEMEQAGPAQAAALVEAAAKPTASERIAARRAAMQEPAVTGDVIEPAEVAAAPFGSPDAGGTTPEAETAASLIERLRTNAEGSSFVGPMTEPQQAALNGLFAGVDYAGVIAPVLDTAFELAPGDKPNAAQAQAILSLAASIGPEAFLQLWIEAAS